MEHLAPGVTLKNTYVLERLIGRGGMGEVWLARHLRLTARSFAIKVIYHTNPTLLERLRREAQVMSGLIHPHIAQVIDLDVTSGDQPFMVMEHLQGQNLAQKVSSGPISIEQSEQWIFEIADAIHTAHRHGIIHRDLKPDNLFLLDDGSIKDTQRSPMSSRR